MKTSLIKSVLAGLLIQGKDYLILNSAAGDSHATTRPDAACRFGVLKFISTLLEQFMRHFQFYVAEGFSSTSFANCLSFLYMINIGSGDLNDTVCIF
ncbi:MAG: hypothetical protein ACI9QL_002646 [Candidatus Omnitrophota bacterium]